MEFVDLRKDKRTRKHLKKPKLVMPDSLFDVVKNSCNKRCKKCSDAYCPSLKLYDKFLEREKVI